MTTNKPEDHALFKLANVVLSPVVAAKVADNDVACVVDRKILAEVVWKLAVDKPGWTFKLHDGWIDLHGRTLAAREFRVYHGNDCLGSICDVYGRSGYAVEIKNERIRKERQRGGGYKTSNPANAIAKARKYFSPKTVSEQFDDAFTLGEETLSRQGRMKQRALANVVYAIKEKAVDYVVSHSFTQFVDHLKLVKDAETLTRIDEQQSLNMEINTLEEVRNAFRKNASALVIRDGSSYLVKVLDNVQLYTDTTLPSHMASKIGMLKLVDNDAVISGVGCKIDGDVFIVMMNDVNETKGESNADDNAN